MGDEYIFDDAEPMEDARRYAQDNLLYVQFYRKAVLCPYASAQQGRPIHTEQDFVKIAVPGNRLSNVDTIATVEYQRRFAKQWETYQAGQSQVQSGTLLSSWGGSSMAMTADLGAMGIVTVEQLATISDTIAGKIPGGATLRDKAISYLDASTDAAVATKLAEEKAAQDAEIADLKEQMAALQAQLSKAA